MKTRSTPTALAALATVTALTLCVATLGLTPHTQSLARAQDDWDEDYTNDSNDAANQLGEGAVDTDEYTSDSETGPGDDSNGLDDAGSNKNLFSAPDDDPAADTPTDGLEPPADNGSANEGESAAITLDISAGVGFGTLRMDLPEGAGHRVLPETAFAAAGVSLTVHIMAAAMLSVNFGLAYQTSLGLKLRLEPLFGLPEEVHVRFQHLEGHVAPVLRFGHTSASIAVPLGFALNTFTPLEHQYGLKQLVIGGPFARLEFRTTLGNQLAILVGPEVRWLATINSVLTDAGATGSGVGVGLRGALRANIGGSMHAELSYREFHAFAPASKSRYRHKERFLTARLGGQL